jgi:DNA-directed RNA polymerase III subunit RPC6
MSSAGSASRKRSVIAVGNSAAVANHGGAKRPRSADVPNPAAAAGGGHVVAPPSTVRFLEPESTPSNASSVSALDLKNQFLEKLSAPPYAAGGISNSELKTLFGQAAYLRLVPIINELNQQSRLRMSHLASGELSYQLVPEDLAVRLDGLDASSRLVYQVIERSKTAGIWTKDIRMQTNIQQQMLTKILKNLEQRQLIKPVKSVTQKAKKLYMLYELEPSKEITGGVWYSDQEFDHSFISELREFLLQCLRRLNGGKGCTVAEIKDKIQQSNVSRVALSNDDIGQLMRTLVYDHLVEEVPDHRENNSTGHEHRVYQVSKRLSSVCDFAWWDTLKDDFHFRTIVFEDGITLGPHEPHYHTSS